MPESAVGFRDTAINSSSKISSLMTRGIGKGLNEGKGKKNVVFKSQKKNKIVLSKILIFLSGHSKNWRIKKSKNHSDEFSSCSLV